ncbi:MAG: helix-turn-helix transcriptional regulator [Clostridia bacterium]|nr:helix-turn-helix transcriptional regulator [Clostridia bacterium]
MIFEDMRIKDVRAVIHYTPNMAGWYAKERKDHFIGIQLCGSAHHKFNNRDFVLSSNCVYFFNQKDDYRVEVYERGESFSVHFTTYEDVETDSFCVPVENPEEFISLLQKAELLKHRSEEGELTLLSTLYKLCDVIARARRKTYFQRDGRIIAAKDYVEANFESSRCLSEAVALSGLSPRRFNDLFKGLFGTTPNRYLVLRRIEHAKSLLETQGLTVTEVAELCGFSDVYYFSKVFKQICGIPPSEWK